MASIRAARPRILVNPGNALHVVTRLFPAFAGPQPSLAKPPGAKCCEERLDERDKEKY